MGSETVCWNAWWRTVTPGVPVRAIGSIAAAVIAMSAVIAVVTAPVVVAPAPASATTPAIRVGTDGYLKIKITGHIAEKIAPDVIKDVETVVPSVIAAPSVTVVIVPGHVPCDRS